MNNTVTQEVAVPTAPTFKVYFRNADGSLGQVNAIKKDHKDAILAVKELLVAEGDCLTNKAVLAVIEGGMQ